MSERRTAGPGAESGARAGHRVVEPPEVVQRWQSSGGTWAVSRVGENSAAVELITCDGGEVVDVLTLREPREIRWAAVQRAIGGGR